MLPTLFVATTAWVANPAACVHQRTCARTNVVMQGAEAAAKAAWLARTAPAWSPPDGFQGQGSIMGSIVSTSPGAPRGFPPVNFLHAPIFFFAPDQLAAKGSRRSQGSAVDIGEPYDFSKPLAKDAEGKVMAWNDARVGSWACTPGGWDSPKLRPTTETFLVLDGEGSVTDVDGTQHPFGAGDVVVLPKHWSGRWDIQRTIHKIWVVHDHADVPGASDGVVRAVVASAPHAVPDYWGPPVVTHSLHEAPANQARTIYDVGPTRVGFLLCQPGSFSVAPRTSAEMFFVVDGVFFLTNEDGSACRCTAGDTVVLPPGWSGHWDIIEPVSKVWVDVE